jgi:hypothetical protein
MVFIKRDPQGNIVAIAKVATEGYTEQLPEDHPDVSKFLTPEQVKNLAKQMLTQSDTDMIRIIEDVIDILVQKNVIQFTELPGTAQDKILSRKRFRKQIAGLLSNDNNENINV